MPRYIATIPNNVAGEQAVGHLKELARNEYGITYVQSLSEFLHPSTDANLRAPGILDDLPYGFHVLDIPEDLVGLAIPRILRWHSDPTGRTKWRGHIEAIEPNVRMKFSTLGLPFHLGGFHSKFLTTLNIGASRPVSEDVTVALLDTGSDSLPFISDFYDLTPKSPSVRPGFRKQIDVDGHGSAMASLVHEVAPNARLEMVRITDVDPEYLHVLAGVAVAVFDCQADIVNLSLGFVDFGGTCGSCGADAVSRSIALEKMLRMITQLDPANTSGLKVPIFVAATGNDTSVVGFDFPARFDEVIAVGCVNSTGQRSTFSNYGTTMHPTFLVAPGGEDTPGIEDVGSGSKGSCFGTSVATAYVSGILALMRQDANYWMLDRDGLIKQLVSMCVRPAGRPALEYGHGTVRYV